MKPCLITRLICFLIIGTTPVMTLNITSACSLKSPLTQAGLLTSSVSDLSVELSPAKGQQSLFEARDRKPLMGLKEISGISHLADSIVLPRRAITVDVKGEVTKELTKFFAGSPTARNVFIIYEEELYAEISASVGACFQMTSEVTLLTCEEAPRRLKGIIRSFKQLESLRNIVVLCSSNQILAIFQKIHDEYLESASTHWFVVLQEDETTSYLPLLREGTQVSFALEEDGYSYLLMNSYVNINNKVALRHIGWWSWNSEIGPRSSLKVPLVRPLKEIYSDFGGRVLTTTVVKNWPFWVLEYPDDVTIKPVSGLDFHVLKAIGDKLNFTFRVSMTPDRTWGGILPNGTVTGMVGQVHYHLAHTAINEVTLTAARTQAVDFTLPYFLESSTLISPAPSKNLKPHAIFTSFTYEVWILVVIVTMLIGPLVRAIVWLRNNHMGENIQKWESLSDVTFHLFKSITIQASVIPPEADVYRLIVGNWYIFCFLTTSLYSDVMISMLAVPSYEKAIDSLYDLLDAIDTRGYMNVINCGSNSQFIFSDTNAKIYKDIWSRFDTEIGCIPPGVEGIDKVLTGKFVYVDNRMGSEALANLRGRERFHFAYHDFYAHGYSIACPLGSPYRDVFQDVLYPLMWSGIVRKYIKDELFRARRGITLEESGLEPFAIKHLQAAFYLFIVGNAAALVALLLEWAFHYYRRTALEDAAFA